MGSGRLRRGSRRADDVDGGHVTADVRVRGLTAADEALAPALAELHAQAHAAGMALGRLAAAPSALEDEYRGFVRQIGERSALVVAEDDDGVVGMAQLVGSDAENARHRAEVRRVAVAADVRGRGIGAQLMAAVEDAARGRAITLLWLTTHADTAASSFYESVGYTRLGVMPSYSARPDGSLADGAFFYRVLAPVGAA